MPIDPSNVSVSHRFNPYSTDSLADKFDNKNKSFKELVCRKVAKEIEANQCITNKLLGRILTITGCPDIKKGRYEDFPHQGLRFNDGSFFTKNTILSPKGTRINKLYGPDGKLVPE